MKLKDTCSLEGKLWKPRQCIKKQRQYCTLTKIHRVKIMVFPLVMNRCESWTIKAKHQRIYACELWCRRRLLRIPWTARRSKLSILKEINPEYSLERQILKLKLQYFGYLMARANSLEETLMLGKIDDEDDRGWNGWMASLHKSLGKPQEIVEDMGASHGEVHGVAKSRTQLSDWTTTN